MCLLQLSVIQLLHSLPAGKPLDKPERGDPTLSGPQISHFILFDIDAYRLFPNIVCVGAATCSSYPGLPPLANDYQILMLCQDPEWRYIRAVQGAAVSQGRCFVSLQQQQDAA
jgi:hypothetical protein